MQTEPPTPPNPDPNPQPKITTALIDRVSERLAMGLPLKMALAGEKVTRAEYKDYLSKFPELQDLQELAKRKVLESAFSVMLEGEQAAANWRWLIELIYKDVLGNQDDESPKQKQTILGIPEEIIEQMRENAKRL
jgi:hypothetical protein